MKKIRVWFSLASSTFFELSKDRFFYTSFLIAVGLQFLILLASRLTFIRPERIVIDGGATAILWVGLGVGVLLGSGLIPNELERKTANVILSKPVSRMDFMFSKAIGLGGVLGVNQLVLGAVWLLMMFQIQAGVQEVQFQFLLMSFWVSWLSGLFAMMISGFSSRTVAVLLGLGFYGIGVNGSLLSEFFPGPFMKGLRLFFFDFERFHLGLNLSYGVGIPGGEILMRSGYAFFWGVVLVILASVVMKKRW